MYTFVLPIYEIKRVEDALTSSPNRNTFGSNFSLMHVYISTCDRGNNLFVL